jgi:hypothetical protein
MLSATWLGTAFDSALRQGLPLEAKRYPGDGRVKLVFLIDVPEDKRELLIAIMGRAECAVERQAGTDDENFLTRLAQL